VRGSLSALVAVGSERRVRAAAAIRIRRMSISRRWICCLKRRWEDNVPERWHRIDFQGLPRENECDGRLGAPTFMPGSLELTMPHHSSRDHLEECLARIDDPEGEGARVCLTVYTGAARAAADAADARAKFGISLGPLDGAVVTIKDLFDVAGDVTRAGSKVLAEEGLAATQDAPVVRRLRTAGAVIVAKTNMSEFAFSGLGTNPHFGTPGMPADRTRVPGGSSSGAAVAAADGMCEIAIGTDTGGSTRIPAAFCGVVGFKPSKRRITTEGAFPLSYTMDSIGPLARSVDDCARADAVLAGCEMPSLDWALAGCRLGIVQGTPLDKLEDTVAARFQNGLTALEKAGARLTDEYLALIDDMNDVNAKGGITPTEAYAVHHQRLAERGDHVDPHVRLRIERAGKISAADYIDMMRRRDDLVRAMDARLQDVDAVVMPTTPIVAPTMDEVSAPETFARKNGQALRNTAIINFFDLCAISLPLPRERGLPVGLMLVARNGEDARLFAMAAAIERLFN
jgi:aspartyl-tRNA(Asn)/glutamyl-tRNA(Gln) amidotransferase subunit A